jgi:hypothetical protein
MWVTIFLHSRELNLRLAVKILNLTLMSGEISQPTGDDRFFHHWFSGVKIMEKINIILETSKGDW